MLPTPHARTRPQDRLFIALSFVIIMIVVLTSHNAAAALLIIGLTVALVVLQHGGGHHPPHGGGYFLPHGGGHYLPHGGGHHTPQHYRGAIDIDDYDTEPDHGHRDRGSHENDYAPHGNRFNMSRVGAPHAASACYDDEANDDELDGDERINYQALARNDPLRATVGTIGRRASLDAYLREEVVEEEDRDWWGRHEV